jgi:chromosome segregation ATPase
MSLFTMIFIVVMAGLVGETLVKLVRGHPAKEKEIRGLREKLAALEHHVGECLAELEDTRASLAREAAARAELEERLDFTERVLASGREDQSHGSRHVLGA